MLRRRSSLREFRHRLHLHRAVAGERPAAQAVAFETRDSDTSAFLRTAVGQCSTTPDRTTAASIIDGIGPPRNRRGTSTRRWPYLIYRYGRTSRDASRPGPNSDRPHSRRSFSSPARGSVSTSSIAAQTGSVVTSALAGVELVIAAGTSLGVCASALVWSKSAKANVALGTRVSAARGGTSAFRS